MRGHARPGQEEQTAGDGIFSHLTDFCELRTRFDQTRGKRGTIIFQGEFYLVYVDLQVCFMMS